MKRSDHILNDAQPRAVVRSNREASPPSLAAPYTADSGRSSSGVSMLEYGWMLYRRKGVFLLITAAGLLIAGLITLAQTPVYQSTASVEIQGLNDPFPELPGLPSTPTVPVRPSEADLETHAEAMRQEPMIERVVKRLKLEKRPEFTQPQGLASILPFRHDSDPDPLRRAVRVAKKNLRITPFKGSRIIRITYDARDPRIAAEFANTLALAYIEENVEARWRGALQVREWLQPQLEEMKGKLEQSRSRLRDYAASRGLVLSSDQENLADEKLRLLQAEFSKAQAERIAKEPMYRVACCTSATDVYDTPAIREYRTRLLDLQRQFADLTSIYKPESYKVSRLKAQLVEVETALRKEMERERERVRKDYESARQRERLLAAAWERETRRAAQMSSDMAHYATLKHELDATREVHDAMLRKINEAEVASAIRPSSIRVIGIAEPAERPRKPNIPLNLALGLFAGLSAAVGCVTMLEQGSRRIAMPGDVEEHLRVPELGAIPAAKGRASVLRGLLGSGRGSRVELSSWENRLSNVSESFRSALASLMVAAREGGPRVVVITSPLPAEGKTTVTCNLGIALAEIGRRVLLIDGDMRRPRLHRVFSQVNSWGLSVLLTERTAVQQLPLEALVRKTAVPNLFVLPSGPGTDSIFRLLCSEHLAELMRRFRGEFDHVLIDAPPSLEFADARALARNADGVVLVLRAGQIDGRTALSAVRRLYSDGIPVLGAILNNWNPKTSNAYGYHGLQKIYQNGDKNDQRDPRFGSPVQS